MASESADATAAPESSDASEECPGKKKSRFQTFKNFFAKKKRKEAAAGAAAESQVQVKSSQSIEDVSAPETTSFHADKESDSSSNINVESKALSQDSVFTPSDPPSPETTEALQSSHDSLHGKVKSLQMQLKQAIRLGSPPAGIAARKPEDGGALSEDDGLPCSPPEYSAVHAALTTSSQRSSGVVQRSDSLSPEGSDSDDDEMSGASSRPGTPQTPIPVDFSEPASSLSCLDSSAAHHRIAVRSRACAKRKPASREMSHAKRRDLRERVLLKDAEDKLRATRTSTVEEDEDELDGVHKDSPGSPIGLPLMNEADLPGSSRRSSTATSVSDEDDECVPDQDHVAIPGILESPWENPIRLELQTDDFLLEEGCEVVSEEQGSLLAEVLSSLKGPLGSGLVLESEATLEQMEVEDTAGEAHGETQQPCFTDPPSEVPDEQVPVTESVTLLQEVESVLQVLVPAGREPAEEVGSEEGGIERHETEDDVKENVAEEMEDVVMEQEEDEEEEDIEEEEQENVEEMQDGEEEVRKGACPEDEMVAEDDGEIDDGDEVYEEENEESTSETCSIEEPEVKLDKPECFHETMQPVEGSRTELVDQPGDLSMQEVPEQPSFVVMTSLELSFPRKTSDQPKETEDVPELPQGDSEEREDRPAESLQIEERVYHPDVDVLSPSHRSSSSESAATATAANESVQQLPDDSEELSLNESPSTDQSFDSIRAEGSASQEDTLPPFTPQKDTADEDATPENPFGVRLRKTPVLHRYASEGESPTPSTESTDTPKSPFLEQLAWKPAFPKKPDHVTDGVVKPKRTSDLPGKAPAESSEPPSWISLARQKQKVFKENSLDESPDHKEDFITEDQPLTQDQLKTVAPPVKVSCSLEISKPALVEKEKRTINHPVPVPLTQDEPPWLALAKKKAKAWSEMPQIVQ